MNMVENGNAKIVEITPEMARQYLAQNSHNRCLSDRAVRELVTAIKNGEWQVNGEASVPLGYKHDLPFQQPNLKSCALATRFKHATNTQHRSAEGGTRRS